MIKLSNHSAFMSNIAIDVFWKEAGGLPFDLTVSLTGIRIVAQLIAKCYMPVQFGAIFSASI